ncbi:MAG: dephospho-CoA kinase [Phycisphaerales bacterium]|nr:dephospho-CoA kinase [Phycisphaerales bacterium]
MTRNGLPVIGLTGGIGSGKSRVAAMLRELGCVVSDADAVAKAMLDEDSVRTVIASWWGNDVFDETGHVDRAKVADHVFADPEELQRLEALLHPMVERMRAAEFDAAPEGTIALVIDAPLLLEAGLDEQCDVVLFVDTPAEVRQKRLVENRGWTVEEIDRREAQQMSLDAKRSRAHHVLKNHGGIDDLQSQVERILETIVRP